MGLLYLPFWGVVALLLLLEALVSIWSQKGLAVDLARREIALVGRRPRKISRQVYPFSSSGASPWIAPWAPPAWSS